MTVSRHVNQEILALVGEIVLSTQDAERYLKVILPFTNSENPSYGAAIARHEKLKRRTFGDLIGKFVDATTSDSPDYAKHLAKLVDERNQIVHHFDETYGLQLRSGNTEQALLSLRVLLANVNGFRRTLIQAALHVFETIRDTAFQGTPEFQEMHDVCLALRQRVAD